jgi:hypothetical protein
MNWYAYVGSDPVNGRDVKGLTGVYCTGSMLRHDSCSEVGGLRCSGDCRNFLSPGERDQIAIAESSQRPRPAPQVTFLPGPTTAVSAASAAFLTQLAAASSSQTNGPFVSRGVSGFPIGLFPIWTRSTVNSFGIGGHVEATSLFIRLSTLAGDTGVSRPPLRSNNVIIGALILSLPSHIGLRIYPSGRGRVDIPAGVFSLTIRETIHFEDFD